MNKNKILKFIIQSLIIFLIWLVGEVIIYILKFSSPATVSIVWTVIAVIGCSVYRMMKNEKKNND